MQDVLYIIMPAYNEEESLPEVLDSWYSIVAENDLNRFVVINDGSTDGTKEILESYSQTHPQLVAINKDNSGHGASIYEGYVYALEQNANYIFQTDSDGQTNPAEFQVFFDTMKKEKCDAILGVRNERQDGFSRSVITRILRMVVGATLHVDIEDSNVPFRLMSNQALSEALSYVPNEHMLTNVILSASLIRLQKDIRYIPISFKKRSTGNNSINFKAAVCIGLNAISDFRDVNKRFIKDNSS